MKKETQAQVTPVDAITLLKAGNERFLEKKTLNHNYLEQIKQTAKGQYPFAAILGCIDSRVPAEIIFDQGIGDIFNTRIAGNIVNTDIIASLEFACKAAGAKAIVVLGHTACGAVTAACEGVELANITALLQKIKPAVTEIKRLNYRYDGANTDQFIEKVVEANIYNSIRNIKKQSKLLSEMMEKGEIGIVGAMSHIETGRVRFLPEQ